MTLAVGVYQPKSILEVSKMRRVARIFDADITFQIGGIRGELAPNVPHVRYADVDQFMAELGDVKAIALEIDTHSLPLAKFEHPEDAAYLIGPENGTIPHEVLDKIGRLVEVETPIHGVLSPSGALAVVLHDRYVTLTQKVVA